MTAATRPPANKINEAFAAHREARGLTGNPAHPDSDAFGEALPGVEAVDVGWMVTHGTLKYEGGACMYGAVVNVYERDGQTMVTVAEEQTREGDFDVRRRDWKVNELDPAGCHPIGVIIRHSAAKKLLRVAGRNVRMWDFGHDEWLVASALNLTEPERKLRFEAKGTACAEGHCVDVGECAESRDHLGVCCEPQCGATVPARVGGKVRAS